LRLAEAGADVVVNFVSAKAAALEAAERIQAMGRRALVVRADVSEQEDVQDMIARIREEFGRLDILVHNAASGGFRTLMAAKPNNFQAVMNTNVQSFMFLMQSAADLLKGDDRRGKAVVLTSHGTHMALPAYGLIGGSKAALAALARHFCLELGHDGVNVNIVEAGLVETDSTRRIPNSREMFDGRKYKSMMGDRFLESSDVADAVLYLSSPLSDLVQGQTLIVDGGAAIHI
jgi:enoyl-[acyl-carrier protein] reductase III